MAVQTFLATSDEGASVAPAQNSIYTHNEQLAKNLYFWQGDWWGTLRRDINVAGRPAVLNYMGITKQRLSRMINSERDLRMSTIIRLSVASGYVPHLVHEPIDTYARRTAHGMPLVVRNDGTVVEYNTYLCFSHMTEQKAVTIQHNSVSGEVLLSGVLSSVLGLASPADIKHNLIPINFSVPELSFSL